MIKHVGKHSDRKVAIIFREVPGEEHMCLVVYTETLPVAMHDALMKNEICINRNNHSVIVAMLLKIFIVKNIITCKIHGPVMTRAMVMARILGIKERVCSLIWVAA